VEIEIQLLPLTAQNLQNTATNFAVCIQEWTHPILHFRIRLGLDVEGFFTLDYRADAFYEEPHMEWTKPEFAVVAVTMEVTAYAATK
jgi:coenzyme PQQ precursor peptide PqqA